MILLKHLSRKFCSERIEAATATVRMNSPYMYKLHIYDPACTPTDEVFASSHNQVACRVSGFGLGLGFRGWVEGFRV